MKVVVTGRIPEAGLDVLREIVGDDGTLFAWDRDEPIPVEVRDAELADADAAVTLLTDRVDAAFLDAAPRLRIVANVAVGHDNIDRDACAERGVRVSNTPGVLTDATADLAMALVLMATRRLGEGERLIRSGAPWEWGMFMMLGSGLRGRRLGIIGMGEIGTAVAVRARVFGMEVGYHNRRPVEPDVAERTGAEQLTLDELLRTSDVVSLHCPSTPETRHLIDATALDRMPGHAFLINTARGSVVDEAALVEALRSGAIAGAALDVFEHEPEVHPGLLGLENVVLIPHLGSATTETRDAMARLAAENVRAVLETGEPLTPVA